MRIVFVGGGSGGHFYPLVAIAEATIARAKQEKITLPELYYMGPTAYDAGSLFAYGMTYVYCPAGKKRRYFSIRNYTDVFVTLFGICIAFWKLFVIYPDAVMSKGSYTSVPVVIAAWLLRIPIVIHESDVAPGRANRLARHFAQYIGISYEKSIEYFPTKKTALVGIPIRAELLEKKPQNPLEILGIPANKPLICVFGGSMGAERVNDLILSALADLLPNYHVLHQVGEKNLEMIQKTDDILVENKELLKDYYIHGFMDVTEVHAALSAASIVVSRAGSTSIHEIAIHGQASILIPIPEDISHDQRTNAYTYARTGAATVIEERNLTPHLLVAEINRIMSDQNILESMRSSAAEFARRDAADRMSEILILIGNEHE